MLINRKSNCRWLWQTKILSQMFIAAIQGWKALKCQMMFSWAVSSDNIFSNCNSCVREQQLENYTCQERGWKRLEILVHHCYWSHILCLYWLAFLSWGQLKSLAYSMWNYKKSKESLINAFEKVVFFPPVHVANICGFLAIPISTLKDLLVQRLIFLLSVSLKCSLGSLRVWVAKWLWHMGYRLITNWVSVFNILFPGLLLSAHSFYYIDCEAFAV